MNTIEAAVFELPITTHDGQFLAFYSEGGLRALNFPRTAKAAKRSSRPSELPKKIKQWHEMTTKALMEALAGRPPSKLPPLDLSSGTEFQRRVWKALQRIGCGVTWSYGEVATAIANSKAVRAVGAACGANPVPVLIPCHRVLAANHRLGGFSGGLGWKRTLLAREGVTTRP